MNEFFKVPKEVQEMIDFQTKLYKSLFDAQVEFAKALVGVFTPPKTS